MSNQRSCVLFIALVIILIYLYYESIQKKASHETREKLLVESSSSNRIQKEESKVLFGRHLLSYSTESVAEVPSEKEISSLPTSYFKFRTVNTLPYADHRNKLKRIKRNVRDRKGIYKWKFNVSVSKLDNELTKPTDNLKNSVEENQTEEESLNVEIYVDGKTKQFKNLEHSWHAVKDSLRNFYKEPKEPQSKDVLNSHDFSSQTSNANIEDSAIIESGKLTSSKNSFLTVQSSSEKPIREETRKVSLSSKGREAKFLFLDFGGGGNKENPPILPENGDNMVSKDTPTESMHDLSFINSTEQFDIKIVPSGVFSSTLLPEHQNLDLPVQEPNLSFTTSTETKLDSIIKVSNPTSSNEILNCDDCMQEIKPGELQTVIGDKKDDATSSLVQTNIPINVVDISPVTIQMFCSNFVQSIQKSPRFEEDIGSGRLDTDNNMEIFKTTDIGHENLNVDEIESFRVTTPPVTTLKTTQQQLSLLQRLWNRIPNLRSRNQRNLVNDDLEISGFPTNFSVQDCKDLFTNQIKSEFNTLPTTLEETILTETKSIPLFSPGNLISETENSLKSSLASTKKSDVVEVAEITTMLTTDLIVQFQNKPSATESTSNVFQNVPSFFDEIITTVRSNMVSISPIKQTKSIGNLDKTTIAEELSLKIEDSGEPKVSRSTVIGLITTSTASPLKEALIDLNTKSSISLSVKPNTISNDTPEDLDIIPSELVVKEDKRFFSDLNNDDILELGSSDERIISDKVATIDDIRLKEVTFDENTLISERRFLPNFFSGGSGARELYESFTTTDINVNKNEFLLSETNVQSLSESPFLENENALKKTTVDFMLTSTADEGRRFLPNFFSEGSGARELPESFISTDINGVKNEFYLSEANVEGVSDNIFLGSENVLKKTTVGSMQTYMEEERRFIPNFFSEGSGARELPEFDISTDVTLHEKEIFLSDTKVKSVSDGIFLEEENAMKETINFMQTPMATEGRRFIPNFFSEGSGARELPELYTTTVSDRILVEELSKKETSRNDILINNYNQFSLEPFDIGSGERKLDGIEVTISTEDSNINFRGDYVSLSEFKTSSSDSGGLINEKIFTDILPKPKTDTPVHHEIFMNDIGYGEFIDQNKDNSDQNFIFRSSGDERDFSEVLFNDTVFTPEKLCTNCADNLNFPNNSDSFDYFEETEIPDSSVANETEFKSSANISHSVICNDCEEPNNEKFSSASEYSLTTQKTCINCSVSTEKSKSQTDIFYLTAEESPTENKLPSNVTMMAHSAISYSQDSEVANSTLSNSNKNDPIFVDLLNRNETDTHDENKIYLDPEPETTVQPSKSTKSSRRARLNDILPPDILDFSSKPETLNDVPSKSSIIDSTFIDLSGVKEDIINIDQMHRKPAPDISSLTRRRGARFDVSPTHVPGLTSNQETTQSEGKISIPPKQSVNLFQSRRGARGHDLFDLENFNSEATEPISKKETEAVTLSTIEETGNTLTETKIDLVLNHTLIFDDKNNATKSTDLSKDLRVFSTELPRNKNESFTSLFSEHSSVTDSIPSASSTEEMQSLEVNLNPELTLPSPKFCHSASECNVSLNERCMPHDEILICNCGRSFSRNLKTKKCEATITLQTSITLPGERFYEDLKNNNTYLYKQKKRDYIKIMWFLLKHDPNLFHTVAEVDITSFEEGSLIVNYTLKLLGNGNETASELAQLLQEDLNKIINDQEVLKNASLEFKNASVSISVLNPCLSSEMNYCHKNALCISTEEKGFKCQCKADYLDNSWDKRYPGENCTGICPSNYCGTNGECFVKDNGEKKCRCEGWYLGERCEMNGLVVIAVFAFASFLIIAIVVLFVFYCKKNRNRQFYNRNMSNFQPGQDRPTTGDAIVLDEVTPHCRMSKFLAISTPLYEAPNPRIQVTSPSFTGSSIDYDSTFDRTPYDSESSRNTSCVAPKV